MLESFQRVQWRDWLSDYMFFNNPEKKLESDYMFFNNPEKKNKSGHKIFISNFEGSRGTSLSAVIRPASVVTVYKKKAGIFWLYQREFRIKWIEKTQNHSSRNRKHRSQHELLTVSRSKQEFSECIATQSIWST